MTAKTLFSGALILALLPYAPVRAQTPPTYSNGAAQASPVPATAMQGETGLSDWITYRRGGYIMGPVGANGPIGSEVYLRGGIDIPFGGNLGDILQTGWSVQGGGRALLFNAPETAAWTIDVGLSNINNYAAGGTTPFTISQPGGATVTVNMQRLNRTFFGLGGGRQWFGRAAPEGGLKWLAGLDGGGRYGSANATYAQIRHRTDTIGGFYLGGGGGLEVPLGNSFLEFGVRGEYSYTWSDINERPSDVGDMGILMNFGLRF